MIKKVKKKGKTKWQLWSSDGSEKLGEHDTEEGALAQERAIQVSKARKRAMEAIEVEYADDMFEKDLKTIESVDIFAVGTWHGTNSKKGGDKYTEKDLQQMVDAFKAGIWKPNLKVTHGADNEQINVGRIQNLRVKGRKLLADFVDVPRALYSLMKKGLFSKRSAEVMWNMKDKAGQVWPRVLKAVALLAPGQKPAVTALSDGYKFEAMYCYELPEEITVEPTEAELQADELVAGDSLSAIDSQPKTKTSRKEVKRMEIDALLKKYGVETVEELEAAIEKERAEKQAQETRLKEYASREAELRRKDREQFVQQMKKDGKLLPKHESVMLRLFEAVDALKGLYNYELGGDAQEGSAADMLKSFIADLPNLVELGREKSIDDKTKDVDLEKPRQEVDRLARQFIASGDATDYPGALGLISRKHPDLWKKYQGARH